MIFQAHCGGTLEGEAGMKGELSRLTMAICERGFSLMPTVAGTTTLSCVANGLALVLGEKTARARGWYSRSGVRAPNEPCDDSGRSGVRGLSVTTALHSKPSCVSNGIRYTHHQPGRSVSLLVASETPFPVAEANIAA